MYFAELTVFLSLYYNVAGFNIYGYRNRQNFRIRELNAPDALSNSSAIKVNWMTQPLDHFNHSEKRTWKMRYFQRLDMWKPNGPIFLLLNGEGRAENYFLKIGIMYDLAKETEGAMFSTEHRYYGCSKPFKNYATKNLMFLSSRQALADNAKILKKIRLNPLYRSSKIVVIGGSYSGNLAAWMKLLYPDLVDAAIASSAPVLAKADFFEYLETVSDNFKQYGTPGCFDKIAKMFDRYEQLLKTDEGIQLLKEEEQICDKTDMKNLENQHNFFLAKASIFMEVSQYENLSSIKKLCKKIDNNSRVFLHKDVDEAWSKTQQCYNYEFDDMIKSMKRSYEATAWTYQTCTEFGYFQTSNSNKQPFTNNIPDEFYYNTCKAMFGQDFDDKRVKAGVLKTNKMYGGLRPNVTKVVFVNGELDPWHRLSVLKDLSNEAPAKVVPFSSHCSVLFPDRPNDPKELKEAKRYTKNLIKNWIGAGENLNINQ